MKIPRQEDVSTLMMVELALIYPNGLLSLHQLSIRHGISVFFLKKLARYLKKAGLIEAKEGLNGGYHLTRNPGQIKVWDIIKALNTNNLEYQNKFTTQNSCPINKSCLPQTVRSNLLMAIKNGFSNLTLTDFIN